MHDLEMDMPISRISDIGFVYNGSALRFKIEFCFKVIGLISPEATWVKKGNEFDEGEIELEYHISAPPPNIDYRVRKSYYNTVTDNKKYVIVKIKGPCGHFH